MKYRDKTVLTVITKSMYNWINHNVNKNANVGKVQKSNKKKGER
jgi:hypothetical protein